MINISLPVPILASNNTVVVATPSSVPITLFKPMGVHNYLGTCSFQCWFALPLLN